MSQNYHGILVKESLKGENQIKFFKVIGSRQGRLFFLLKIDVPEEKVEETISKIQSNLKNKKYYTHLYRNNEIIVIFPDKIIRNLTPDKSTWKEFLEYGRSLNIPDEQLDLKPCKFEDETY